MAPTTLVMLLKCFRKNAKIRQGHKLCHKIHHQKTKISLMKTWLLNTFHIDEFIHLFTFSQPQLRLRSDWFKINHHHHHHRNKHANTFGKLYLTSEWLTSGGKGRVPPSTSKAGKTLGTHRDRISMTRFILQRL